MGWKIADFQDWFSIYMYVCMSRDSSDCIGTGYGLNGRGLISVRGKRFFFFIVSRPALGPVQSPI
jgi:hypothetical protein